MIAVEINLIITMTWEQEFCTTETFQNMIFDTVIGNGKLWPLFVIC